MEEKIKIDLGKVQETLLLPLWGRAMESKKGSPHLIDLKAIDIIEKINYDFTTIIKNINHISQLAWVSRSILVDMAINDFAKKHLSPTIVNIGCGLDTTYERNKDDRITFYDLDLPDVINLRMHFFSDEKGRKTISGSVLEDDWINEIKEKEGVLFIAAGVFYYFHENEVKELFNKIADNFIRSEIFFDAVTPLGLKTANKRVIQGGGIDVSAFLKWSLKSPVDMTHWDERIKLINKYPLFKGMKKGYPLRMKYALWLSDFLKIMYLVHLKIN